MLLLPGRRFSALPKSLCRSGGIGRRAWFRSMYPQGCGGSSPFFGTRLTIQNLRTGPFCMIPFSICYLVETGSSYGSRFWLRFQPHLECIIYFPFVLIISLAWLSSIQDRAKIIYRGACPIAAVRL